MNRLPFLFILLTLMIDAIGIGLILPVLPTLIQEVTGGICRMPRCGAVCFPPALR